MCGAITAPALADPSIGCAHARRFPRSERDRDHRRPRARRQPRRALARMQLPVRGGRRRRSSRRRASTRPTLASAEIDRAVRDGARRRPAALRGRRRAARAARARPDRHPGSVRGLRRLERRGASASSHVDVETVSLDPRDLEEIEDSIRTLARHLGAAGPRRAARAGHAPPHRLRAPARARPPAPARVRGRVARPALRRRALGAGDGGPRRRRRGARPAARALLRDDLGGRRATRRRS